MGRMPAPGPLERTLDELQSLGKTRRKEARHPRRQTGEGKKRMQSGRIKATRKGSGLISAPNAVIAVL